MAGTPYLLIINFLPPRCLYKMYQDDKIKIIGLADDF